jgi:hypothetical protein
MPKTITFRQHLYILSRDPVPLRYKTQNLSIIEKALVSLEYANHPILQHFKFYI